MSAQVKLAFVTAAAAGFIIWAAPHFGDAARAFYIIAGMFLMLMIFALSVDREAYRKSRAKFDEMEARVDADLRHARERMFCNGAPPKPEKPKTMLLREGQDPPKR